MADVTHEARHMNFVSKKLDIPLFLVTRNRIRWKYLNPMRNYIGRKSSRYTRNCNEENATETVTTKKWKHIAGFDFESRPPCPLGRPKNFARGLKMANWKLAPNRYGMPKEPFAGWKGNLGAYWRKEERTKINQGPSRKFYDVEFQSPQCSKYKGIFLKNARFRRPTARCIISNLQSCYRNPCDPAPNRYFPQNFTIHYNALSPVKSKPPNPHIFYRRSSVPVKLNSIYPLRQSFAPGPGRYDIRFPNVCPCTWRLVYKPGLQLMIDREKRNKFRRLPFTRIKARNYCSPDWRHVPGHGHRRLFRMKKKEKIPEKSPTKDTKETKEAKDAKDAMKVEKKLYPDARYIALINDPNRPKISFRTGKILRYHNSFRIIFHCTQKHGVRHKLGMNKNVAFGSGEVRFKTLKRPKPFTISDLAQLKKRLPLHLQLKEHPVTKTPISDIKPKLETVPLHMQNQYELELRKRLFKFLPLPKPKVLTQYKDVHIDVSQNCYYDRVLDQKLFMNDPNINSSYINT